ncbi:MAG: hypothetical protein FWD67_09235 [Betaproteobacteria bacterium]|nr:hypothetical protein [Betaproteobacteria bacterium]
MKLFQLFVSLFLSLFFVHAQAYDALKFQAIVKQLQVKHIESIDLVTEASLPNKKLSVWILIEKMSENKIGYKTYTVHILVTDTENKILASNVTIGNYEDELSAAKIDVANYQLNDNTRAFGVRLTTERLSRAFGYSSEKFNLFVYHEGVLKKVLNDFEVYSSNKHEMFDNCEGAWDETKTILIMLDKKTNNYNNILAKTQFSGHAYDGKKDGAGNCKESVTRKTSSKTFTFDGSVYVEQR